MVMRPPEKAVAVVRDRGELLRITGKLQKPWIPQRILWLPALLLTCLIYSEDLQEMVHKTYRGILSGTLVGLSMSHLATAVPAGFPASGNGLWFTAPGSNWAREYLPIGNGYLGATTPGGTAQEATQLNIETLWSGGPFSDPTYNGGNKQPSEQSTMESDMQAYRQAIFNSSTGTIANLNNLQTNAGAYGSYAGAGYLVSTLTGLANFTVSNYGRYLDLDSAIARTVWTQNGATYTRESFCSHPTQACVQHTSSTSQSGFSQVYAFGALSGLPAVTVTCADTATLRLTGLVSTPGMTYELMASVRSTGGTISCASATAVGSTTNATITVIGAKDAWVSWVGGTNYDMNAGDAAHNFTFQGSDPHASLVPLIKKAAAQPYASLLNEHVADYKGLTQKFKLDLGQKPDMTTPTDVLKANYHTDSGNPYLEWVIFNYGRYMLASSARGVLPANLQGKWANGAGNAWGADYHSNINIQMNYWSAETTNLDVTESLFEYFLKTWAPRGSETAKTLYNISRGWVTHNEMNIFGHTGMKASGGSAQWADYPESAVWMMIHVWDHFDYTGDLKWFKSVGWPLLKGVASFHLDKLVPDDHFKDGSLVVVPCNSPEQAPITFGCAHAQQLIWQLFDAVEKGFAASGDKDTAFLAEIKDKKSKMDKGIHVGSWGQLQEWKFDMDKPTDTHRHLSHLIGLYPGYALSSYEAALQGGTNINGVAKNYTAAQVLDAAQISLIHRGNGTGPDADSGWEKAWRAACWAQFKNATYFYHELTYTIERDFGGNLFSLYNPEEEFPIFQIDANLAYPGAVMNALVQAPDVASYSSPLIVTLLPALPAAWSSGSLTGARIRGGMSLDITWDKGMATKATITVDKGVTPRPVRIVYGGATKASFTTNSGTMWPIPL